MDEIFLDMDESGTYTEDDIVLWNGTNNVTNTSFSTVLVPLIDEEVLDGMDNDLDGLIDEDCDDDTLNDGDEKLYGTDPWVKDTDGDGLKDYDELVLWGDRWNNDKDGDGKINLLDYDSDNDGLKDSEEGMNIIWLEGEDYFTAKQYEIVSDSMANFGQAMSVPGFGIDGYTGPYCIAELNDIRPGSYKLYLKIRMENPYPDCSYAYTLKVEDSTISEYNGNYVFENEIDAAIYSWQMAQIGSFTVTSTTTLTLEVGSPSTNRWLLDKVALIPTGYSGILTDPESKDTDSDNLLDPGDDDPFAASPDMDGDGLTDTWKIYYFGLEGDDYSEAIARQDGTGNPDTDGLTNAEEFAYYLDPTDSDCDDDALSDGEEVFGDGTHGDTDGYVTDPLNIDTDNDGIDDCAEISLGTNPISPDSDGDGLDDYEETISGEDGFVTLPNDEDSDNDDLLDGNEVYTKTIEYEKKEGKKASNTLYMYLNGVKKDSGAPLKEARLIVGLKARDSSLSGHVVKWNGYTIRSGSETDMKAKYVYISRDVTSYMRNNGAWGTSTGKCTLKITGYGKLVVEDYKVMITERTNPNNDDCDGDTIPDGEEVNQGDDGWVTNPWRNDTDGDGLNDSYEITTDRDDSVSGTQTTSPVNPDTDGDGARDDVDLDPLHNIVLKFKIHRIHHGNAWWTPTLQGLIRVDTDKNGNWDYNFVTKAKGGYTAAINSHYYVDVPDDKSSVRARFEGWSLNWDGDDMLVRYTNSYINTLTPGISNSKKWSGDNKHWITISVTSVRMSHTHTLLLYNDDVWHESGKFRLQEERYFVIMIESSASISQYHVVKGLNTILIPRSIFVDTYLYSQISNKQFTNSNLQLLGEDSSKYDDLSRRVVGMISGSLTASQFSSFISNYLLKDIDGQTVDEEGNTLFYIADVSSQLHTLNLPKDIINLIPYTKIQNSPQSSVQPTGSFIDKLARTVVTLATMIANAIVAVANFIANIASAVVNWCIKAIGSFVSAVLSVIKAVVDAVVSVLNVLVDCMIAIGEAILSAFIQPIMQAISLYLTDIAGKLQAVIDSGGDSAAISNLLNTIFNPFIMMVAMIVGLITTIVGIIMAVISAGISEIVVRILVGVIGGVLTAMVMPMILETTASALSGVLSSLGGFTLAATILGTISLTASFIVSYLDGGWLCIIKSITTIMGILFGIFSMILGTFKDAIQKLMGILFGFVSLVLGAKSCLDIETTLQGVLAIIAILTGALGIMTSVINLGFPYT